MKSGNDYDGPKQMTATLTSPTARWHATERWGQSERLSCCLPSLLWWTMRHLPWLHSFTSHWIQVHTSRLCQYGKICLPEV